MPLFRDLIDWQNSLTPGDSDCPASQRALVRELFGEIVLPVKGKLPITLDARFPYGYGHDMY